MNVTPEMIHAWRTLQNAAAGAYRLQPQVRDAINVLDNSDYMTPIEDAEHTASEDAERLCGCGAKGTHGVDHDDDQVPSRRVNEL